MLLNDDEIQERIESPLNLLNRLRTSLTRHVNKTPPANSPSLPPAAQDIIPDLDDKLNNSKFKAKEIMNLAMDELKSRMGEVQKPERLAQIAREMAQVVNQQESKGDRDTGSKIIVYAPQVLSLKNYEIIDVNE